MWVWFVGRNIPVQQCGGVREIFFLNNQQVPMRTDENSSWNRTLNLIFARRTGGDYQGIDRFVFVSGVLKIEGGRPQRDRSALAFTRNGDAQPGVASGNRQKQKQQRGGCYSQHNRKGPHREG